MSYTLTFLHSSVEYITSISIEMWKTVGMNLVQFSVSKTIISLFQP